MFPECNRKCIRTDVIISSSIPYDHTIKSAHRALRLNDKITEFKYLIKIRPWFEKKLNGMIFGSPTPMH